MKAATYLAALALLSAPAIADDFVDAEVLDVQAKQGATNSFNVLGPSNVESDNYTEITLLLGDTKVSARSYAVGGGVVYLANHPEAVIVGSTVKALLAKHGELHIRVEPDGKILKFKIQRMEKIKSAG